ncbi:MAG: hypothetical protein EBZ47_03095 [Chlamydiae bacterium]|nr:hypothetical protein [Chlamydiota bacterium]
MNWIKKTIFICALYMHQIQSFEIHAHRGARTIYPENTLPAFKAAWESGADFIELDIQITKDRKAIIHHNFSLDPLACSYQDGSSPQENIFIHSLNLEEIKKLNFEKKAFWDSSTQQRSITTTVPTLEEVIDLITHSSHPAAQKIKLNIELKRDLRYPHYSLNPHEIVETVLEVVHKKGFSHRVQYSSFDPEILSLLRQQEPEAILACLFAEEILTFISANLKVPGLDFILNFAKDLKINILSPDHSMIKAPSQIQEMKKNGFKIIVWTVNDFSRCKELLEMGIDGIITDVPGDLAKKIAPKS